MKRSKNYRSIAEKIQPGKEYPLSEAIAILKGTGTYKSDFSLEVHMNLGVDPRHSDQVVRGNVALPHGTGKKVRILVFAKGELEKAATQAGADFVGAEELVEKVKNGFLDFDVVVAHPDMMREVSKLGRVLGPKGLMPTPKTGTVTPQVGKAVKEVKGGRIEFKSDKTAGLHAVCGKLSFKEEALLENARTVIKAVKDSKPATSKGEYFKTVHIATTHGPGLKLNTGAL